ncbi:MAG: type II secretion system F family protein [Candidatus Daviesbacteria bacterium]|nr:type II secretion system F family protein [Candidatus Daviesbacteria bacterium]
MAIFKYVAKDMQGVYHKGEIETADESHAVALLRKKKLIITSLKIKGASGNMPWDKFMNRVPFSEVVIMTRQLATMIEAGLVLSEALDILEDQQENKHFKAVLENVSKDIKAGLDFATALEKHPDIFPPLYSKLVKAGQASGKLDTILLELAKNLEKEREFKSRVRGAMIYPIVIVFMMIVVMCIMVFFVMPKLIGLYKDSGMDLPLPTKIMITGSDIIINFWWLILMVIIGIVILFKKFAATTKGRLFIDQRILKTPVLGKVTSVVILTSFTRTFGLLIASGLSILESIQIVSDITGNKVYQNCLETAYKGVEKGLPLSTQLLSMKEFPKIVGQMVKTGEETGKLDEIILKLSDYFQSEADNALKNITTLIEPIVLVILGIGVGILVISIILPIYQLTTNISH